MLVWSEVLDQPSQTRVVNDNTTIDIDDNTREQARDALRATDQHDEQEYLDALITVIDYHRDETFDTDLY